MAVSPWLASVDMGNAWIQNIPRRRAGARRLQVCGLQALGVFNHQLDGVGIFKAV